MNLEPEDCYRLLRFMRSGSGGTWMRDASTTIGAIRSGGIVGLAIRRPDL